MNLKNYVDTLKYKLNSGAASRDKRFADSYLRQILISARKTLIKRRVDKGESLPDGFYRLQCVDFTNSPYHNCNCAAGTCEFKVSIKSLPEIISSKKQLQIDVLNLNGEYINELNVAQTKYRDKYALLSNKDKGLTWHIQNKRIVLMNGQNIEKLLISYIPAGDIEEVYVMENCGNNSGLSCSPINDVIFYDDDATLLQLAEQIILGRTAVDNTNNQLDETVMASNKK